MHFKPMKLENVGDGQLARMFDEALEKISKDLVDPHKPSKKPRSIEMKVLFDPNEENQTLIVTVECNAKLPKRNRVSTFGGIGQDGRLVQSIDNQIDLELGTTETKSPITPIDARLAGKETR